MHSAERLDYMDNLRALAMFAGVVFHAAIAYSPLLHPIFPTADRAQSPLVDVFAWFLHLFRMPLFFLVAGFFSAMLFEKRGMGGLMANRAKRIGLPFLVFWPLLYALTSWLTVQAALTLEHPSPLLAMIKPFLLMENPPAAPPSTMHLWFLYYLLIFYLLFWCAHLLIPQAMWQALKRPALPVILAALSLLLMPALKAVSAPHPAPESFLPQLWALTFFGAFFLLGIGFYHRADWLEVLARFWPVLLSLSVPAYATFLWLLQDQHVDPMSPKASWSLAALEAVLSLGLTLLALLAGRAFLNRKNAPLRYLADASYWVYLLHLPVLFAIQYRLMDIDAHWLWKFLVSLGLTLLLCLLSYQLLVRHTWLGRWLNGRLPQTQKIN